MYSFEYQEELAAENQKKVREANRELEETKKDAENTEYRLRAQNRRSGSVVSSGRSSVSDDICSPFK